MAVAELTAELRGEVEKVPVVGEPLVEVGEEDGVFDVGLHEEIAHEHSRKVDRMVKNSPSSLVLTPTTGRTARWYW